MTTKTKILFAISLSAFALGFTNILWGLGTPIGAIFLGLFMISKLLEKEMALYDQEQGLHLAAALRASKQIPSQDSKTLSIAPAVAHSR